MSKKETIIKKIRECNPELIETIGKETRGSVMRYKEPQLNHLLNMIEKQLKQEPLLEMIEKRNKTLSWYDLSKSIEENLENEELVDFLYELIK